MNPDRWQQVKGVLDQALELNPEERSSFLERACSTDQSLRREVESLLSSDGEARSSFLASEMTRVTLTKGTKLGDYEVQSLLGSGGMGEVYRARDYRLGRDVAIKVLPPFFASDRLRLYRFEQEARAAAALNHPNILAVYQLGTYDDSPYLVSELLEGETLRSLLKRGPILLEQAIEYALQIASGLRAAHEKGIVHRDLKPENLFVTRDGQVKILDFGLAKQTHREATAETRPASLATETGVLMGTVGYMSPEQLRGQVADHRADIFAFSAILYEMLSGKRAFIGESSADVAISILKENPPPLSKCVSGVPKALEIVVQRCLEKTPEQRLPSVEELTAALRSIELQPPTATRAWRFLGWRARILTKMAIAMALAVAVLAAVFSFRGRDASIDSIAVMPFATKDAEAGTELGDGLTSGLIDSLSQIPQLRVMSRNSVSRYKGKEIDASKVGRELNVSAVLTGTLIPRGDGFLLDTELVKTSDNTHLWGQQYISRPADVLRLQAELASAISSKLRPSLKAETKGKLANQGTSNPEAYALYVKGRYAADRWEARDWKKALSYFQQAVEKDPAYSQAYAGVGEAYVVLGEFYRSPSLQEGIQKGRAAAHRALELDANLAEGHCVLGGAAYGAWEWQEAEQETRRCVELNPNLSIAHQWRSYVLASLGRMDQAIAEITRALELDPVSFTSNFMLAEDYYYARDYDRAVEQLVKMVEIEPNQPDLHDTLANSYAMKGEYDQAAREYEKTLALEAKDEQAGALRSAYAKDGFHSLLKAQIQLWNDPEKREDYCPDQVAGNYALLGDKENAFLWLEKAYVDNDKVGCAGNLLPIKADPFLDNIRSDPRYNAFLRRMGFPQ
jgi:TolB-like protein/Tfp pilus assembly protein PilF